MFKSTKVLTKGSKFSAGFDIESDEEITIKAHTNNIISTGLKLEITNGYYGQLKCRSGLAFKNNIRIFEGVIDSDYRGEVKIKIYNEGNEDFKIKKNDRIAQIIFLKYYENIIQNDNLNETERNEKGFGSSGI